MFVLEFKVKKKKNFRIKVDVEKDQILWRGFMYNADLNKKCILFATFSTFHVKQFVKLYFRIGGNGTRQVHICSDGIDGFSRYNFNLITKFQGQPHTQNFTFFTKFHLLLHLDYS